MSEKQEIKHVKKYVSYYKFFHHKVIENNYKTMNFEELYVVFKFWNRGRDNLYVYIGYYSKETDKFVNGTGFKLRLHQVLDTVEWFTENHPNLEIKFKVKLFYCPLCILRRKIYSPDSKGIIEEVDTLYEILKNIERNIDTSVFFEEYNHSDSSNLCFHEAYIDKTEEACTCERLGGCGFYCKANETCECSCEEYYDIRACIEDDFDDYANVRLPLYVRWYIDEDDDGRLVIERPYLGYDYNDKLEGELWEERGSNIIKFEDEDENREYHYVDFKNSSEDVYNLCEALDRGELCRIMIRIRELQNKRRFSKAKSARK